MNRTRVIRTALVVLCTLLVLGLAAVYPLVARGEAFRSAQWQNPAWLVGLLLVPFVLYRATLGVDARVPHLAIPTTLPFATGPRGIRTRLRDLPGVLRGAALIIGLVAMARPQSVLKGETTEERGIDIVIVLDLSYSMSAVMDGEGAPAPLPGRNPRQARRPTRLDTAKSVIVDFVQRRKSDRIGVVVFGRNAFVLSPPTLDYGLLVELIKKTELKVIDGRGTAIGDAVGTGVARLRRSTAKSKAIILLTDGDALGGSISPEYSASLAKGQGVRVYTVQIGNGDDVDVYKGDDWLGQPVYEKVRYPVNPELLKKMAGETGGEAFVANDKRGLEQSMHSILDSLEKSRFDSQIATMEDLFPFLLVPAVVLIALEALVRILLVRRFP